MKQTEIRVGRETYVGKTQKAATEKALEHLARLMNGDDWAPVIVQALDSTGHYVGVCVKDSTGFWAYRLKWADGTNGSLHSGAWTRQECEFKMRRHLAQQVFQPTPEGCAASLAMIHPKDAEGLRDTRFWCETQMLYARAVAAGKSDTEARLAAGIY